MLLAASSANAISITWTFNDAMFDDGASLTGSFDFDADIGGDSGFSNLNLATSDGDLAGTAYSGDALTGSSEVFFYTMSGVQLLAVTLMDAMTNDGGVIGIAPTFTSGELGLIPFNYRAVTSGSIFGATGLSGPAGDGGTIQLAEPEMLVVFITGLLIIGGLHVRTRARI